MEDDLKEIAIRAGLEILAEQGLTLALNSVTYAKVFAYLAEEYSVSVTRGSVHERIWANQDAYRHDVLTEVVAFLPTFDLGATFSVLAPGTTGNEDVARGIGSDLFRQASDSITFGQPSSVKALASQLGDPAAAELLGTLLDDRSEEMLVRGRLGLPRLAARLGLRQRIESGMSWDQASDFLHLVMGSLLEGGFLNYKSGSFDIFSSTDFRTVDADDVEPWRVVSIGMKALLDFLFELDLVSALPMEAMNAPIDQAGEREMPIVEPVTGSSGSVRRPRQELRRLVVAAGAELLLRDGMELGPELLGYSSVFEYIRRTRGFTVHRSSVHGRIWDSNDAFRLEVLARSLPSSSQAAPRSEEAMQSTPLVLNVDGSPNPLQTAYDTLRILSDVFLIESVELMEYHRLLQIKATLLNRPDSPAAADLREVIRKTDKARLEHYKILFQHHVLDLGVQVKSETNLEEGEALELFAVLVMSTFTGVILSAVAGASTTERTMHLPRDGQASEGDEWSIGGVAARSYFDQIYELA